MRSALSNRTIWLGCLALLALSLAPLQAQEMADARARYLSDIEAMESKFLDLAGAMDSDQYGWRPMDSVRTVSEVFMLIVAENYVVPPSLGAEAAEGMEDASTLFRTLPEITDKDEVLNHLRESFEYCKTAVGSLTDEQLMSQVSFFGAERLADEALFLIITDMHEHLGQAIAYARMNHVVPPWTARAQANR